MALPYTTTKPQEDVKPDSKRSSTPTITITSADGKSVLMADEEETFAKSEGGKVIKPSEAWSKLPGGSRFKEYE